MSHAAASGKVNESSSRGLLCFGFVLTGIATTFLGPILPILSTKWSLTDSQAGRFFLAEFIASTAATLISGWLVRRRGFKFALVGGYSAMALGVATILLYPWPHCLISAALAGLGVGLVIPATNIYIAESSEKRASALNILNACWALGAIIYPVLVGVAIRGLGVARLLPCVGLVLAVVAAMFKFGRLGELTARAGAQEQRTAAFGSAVAFAVMFFVYCGTENAISGWIASYAHRFDFAGAVWAGTPAAFWVFLLAGRLAAPRILTRISELGACIGGLALAIVGAVVIVTAHSPGAILLGGAIAGLGLAPVYPIFISLASGRVETRVMGMLFAAAGIGSATVPWAVGMESSKLGNLQAAMWAPVLGIVVMLGMLTAIRTTNH